MGRSESCGECGDLKCSETIPAISFSVAVGKLLQEAFTILEVLLQTNSINPCFLVQFACHGQGQGQGSHELELESDRGDLWSPRRQGSRAVRAVRAVSLDVGDDKDLRSQARGCSSRLATITTLSAWMTCSPHLWHTGLVVPSALLDKWIQMICTRCPPHVSAELSADPSRGSSGVRRLESSALCGNTRANMGILCQKP